MSDSPWDKPGVASAIDEYWAMASESAFRNLVIDDLKARLLPGNILDVGCGSGRIYKLLRDAGLLTFHPYRGGDSSAAMLEIARTTYPEQKFEQFDILKLKAKADNVLCIQVLQHLPDWRPALEQLLAATRKMLYVVTWFGNGDTNFDPATGFWNNWLKFNEFNAICKQQGRVEYTELGDTAGAVAVYL